LHLATIFASSHNAALPSFHVYLNVDHILSLSLTLSHAHFNSGADAGAPSLMQALRAYDRVMAARGIAAECDTRIYAALLRMSFDATHADWYGCSHLFFSCLFLLLFSLFLILLDLSGTPTF
jgi:hypothetical protein